MGIRLYVGNLPFNVTEAEIRELFSTVGPLSYLSIPTDRETGKQRGFAFVEYRDGSQAEEAVRRFNNQSFQGRSLSVSVARSKDDSQRAVAPARPSESRSTSTVGPESAVPPGDKPGRNFGPDAPSRRGRGKAKGDFKTERGPKRPMREIVRGQFFGDDDDDDDYEDYEDYNADTDDESFDDDVSDPKKNT
jgi:RNA recognition motif-containing protein